MRKMLFTLLFSFIFIYSFSQKWKPTLGFEGGMGGGGMTAILKSDNHLIINNAELKKGIAYNAGIFLQLMKQSYGFEVKADYNWFSAEAESFSTPENISFKYLSVPLIFKIRVSSKEGFESPTWTDESYSLIGNTIYHTPSQYSGGGAFTSNVFLYAGGQYDVLQKATHSYGTTIKSMDDISGGLMKSGYSLVAGVEMTVNLLSFDFSYQKGMKSFDIANGNKINVFFVKVKIRLL